MDSLLRCGRRDGLEVCDDGVDLRRLEVVLEAGMRGVPLLMTSRMTSSWPPSDCRDSGGPYSGW